METDGEGRLLEFLRSAFDRRAWGQNRLSSFEKMLWQLIKIIIKNRVGDEKGKLGTCHV